MLEKDRVAEILDANPKIDPTAVDRGREAAKRLAEVGIQIGDYKLEPALGGAILKNSQPAAEVGRISQSGYRSPT